METKYLRKDNQMGNHTMFTVIAIIFGVALAEACVPVPTVSVPRRQNDSNQEVLENGDGEIRFLPAPHPQIMYLGSVDKKAFYATINRPMDKEEASNYCKSSNMELASSILTESQSQLLSSAVNDFANALGLESPIRFWTLSEGFENIKNECGTAVLSQQNFIVGSALCSDLVELTICETED